MRCPSCGKENSDHFKFCLGCGTTLEAAPPPDAKATDATKIAALLSEADDFERFEMWDEAIARIQLAVDLAPERADLASRLENLKARIG